MTLSCFVCNTLVSQNNAGDPKQVREFVVSDLFVEYMTIDETVAKLLTEIVDKPVTDKPSSIICKQCHNICQEYDSSKKRMQEIKTEITNAFKLTLARQGLEYDKYPKKVPVVTPKKLVLPKSKLQPLPPNYVIDVSKLPKSVNTSPSSSIHLKFTVGTTVFTQTIPTQSSPQITQSVTTDKAVESNIANSLSSILGTKTSTSVSSNTSMLTFEVNDLPKEFWSKQAVKTELVVMDNNGSDDGNDDDLNNDEQPMEIDEECTITKIQSEDNEPPTTQPETESNKNKQLYDVSLLPINNEEENETNEALISKLEVLDEQQDNETVGDEELIMQDESGSVIRFVVSGHKLVYENGSLQLADEDTERDAGQGEQDDSADEAQIELQVSGDEETANAIIAAAQEQGGAFIKVGTGEMFRVKSVKSQLEEMPQVQMVTVQGDQFQCLLCDKDKETSGSEKRTLFDSADEMMQHLRSEHGARLYICNLCKKSIRRRSEYNAHILTCCIKESEKTIAPSDGKGKYHECLQCKKRFTSRTLLTEHLNVHSGARPYTCTVCAKTFASKYTHQAHLKTHQDRPRPYKCKECTKSFMTQQNLLQHEKTHLGIKDFVCNICGKAFGTQHNLEVHGVVHSKSKPYVCGACGKAFARRAEVKDHMRIHTGERPYACDICSATFTQRSNLNSHKRATHMDDKRYECDDCGKRFKRRRLLDYHIKVSHTGERPLECEVCHATFVYPEHFKKHARIHSGEKPFVCEVCGKSFNSRDNRNTHRFIHSDKKPYECLVCGAGYMRKQLLYAHMNTSGHLAESIVVNQPRVQKVKERVSTSENKKTFEVMVTADEDGNVRVVQLRIGSNNTWVVA
ncbi:hypothetical protein O0L34_g10277 [Tuta absoluta]|nr:hypothetical protein O0L34_g10277 [Tuta absoluta]